MKIIKSFENEDIIVSDFGEWVGKNYIDYKSEYKNNQKLIKILLEENKQLKDNWNKLRKWIVYNKHNENTEQHYLVVDYGTLLGKMQELEQGSDRDE